MYSFLTIPDDALPLSLGDHQYRPLYFPNNPPPWEKSLKCPLTKCNAFLTELLLSLALASTSFFRGLTTRILYFTFWTPLLSLLCRTLCGIATSGVVIFLQCRSCKAKAKGKNDDAAPISVSSSADFPAFL